MTRITAPQSPARVPWNRGRIIRPKPPLKPRHIWAIRTRLQHDGHVRDLAMFNVAIDSKLRGCDLVKLRVSDVHLGERVRLRTTIVQQKTGRPVPFEMTEPTRDALKAWLKQRGSRSSDWLFPSRSHAGDHITTRQYGRLVDDWVVLAGLDPASYGTHSLRRTKVALVYKRTGNLRACQLLLGHSKLESTVRVEPGAAGLTLPSRDRLAALPIAPHPDDCGQHTDAEPFGRLPCRQPARRSFDHPRAQIGTVSLNHRRPRARKLWHQLSTPRGVQDRVGDSRNRSRKPNGGFWEDR